MALLVQVGRPLGIQEFTEPGTPIVQWTCNRGLNQAWQTLHHTWHAEWTGVNRSNGLVLDVFEAGPADGTPVIQWRGGFAYNQRWS
ncbi:RICIN domain-containing protein [Kitasatospora sp. NPDC015120]|uniref:RICIN domain-containing protein n=1 Tax=Kitasatospora sp. NPDC015120 TaxID=3364023 RepID=UPI0036F48693